MGNSIDLTQKALAALSLQDEILRNLSVCANTMKALWLILDHVLWCGKINIVKVRYRLSPLK